VPGQDDVQPERLEDEQREDAYAAAHGRKA